MSQAYFNDVTLHVAAQNIGGLLICTAMFLIENVAIIIYCLFTRTHRSNPLDYFLGFQCEDSYFSKCVL